jgi:hypothetical protein
MSGRVALAIALFLCLASAAAEDGKVDFKKTEKGAGELFRGMGQEINRSGILGSKDGKKDEKKEAKKAAAKKDAKKEAKEEAK